MPGLTRPAICVCKFASGLRSAQFAPALGHHTLAKRRPISPCGPAHEYRISSVMVSKRKKSDMALLQQDIPVTDDWAPHAPAAPAGRPRRSGRNLKNSNMTLCPDSEGNIADKENPAADNVKKIQPARGLKDVDNAVDELHAMEDSFRQSVKRQKLAVKSSSVMKRKKVATSEEAAFNPEHTKGDEMLGEDKVAGAAKYELDAKSGRDVTQTHVADDTTIGAPEVADAVEQEDISALKEEGARPPPVNSNYLPLPWKGRLGYACLNTYLRLSNPPVFSSRTCRIASILEHRHPLADPSQPEHATKNRPDKGQPPDIARGQKYVENLGLANARDIIKMIRWNDKYGIKFMRLSSEMFPFASHEEYGYKLAPFAAEVLAEAGKVAGELGHRLTTHPGQFTQLGSPRKEVVRNAIRDLEYHAEMLSLLKLPEQQNKDAIMILHMGGMFGDKEATLQRFRENYAGLSEDIKARLVLENDDVCWHVHDLLPICEELNIPLVLDYHHHNIMFDKTKIREGTKDIMELYPRIKATWDRKGITQKMHYSEPRPEAVTGRQRRKHRPRVMTLPPCPDTMDLMIEAKDKEQAVFELMRTYKLPGWDRFNDVIPYERDDENKPPPKPKAPAKNKKKSQKGANDEEDVKMAEPEIQHPVEVPPEDIGMGGPNNRVYWPIGMEEWLRPKKREVKKVMGQDRKITNMKRKDDEDDS